MKPAYQVILMGASVGGITALSSIANTLPKDFPVPIVAVIRSSSISSNEMDRMIQPFTDLPVHIIQANGEFKAGHIYLAPPDQQLVLVEKDRATLKTEFERTSVMKPVDCLFESAALTYRSSAIGVVLTGEDGDGTQGLKAIKAAGGVSIIQDPVNAKNPDMPSNALKDDHPDYCVPLDDLAELLIRLVSS